MISQSYTNSHYGNLSIDIQIFVIISAIPWFIILPFCSGVFLIMTKEWNVCGKNQLTECSYLLDSTQNSSSRPSLQLSLHINERQTTVDCRDTDTYLRSEDSATIADAKNNFCGTRWGFCIAMIIISSSLVINSGGDFYTSYYEFSDKTRMTFPWHRTRTACHVGAYIINPLLLIPVLISLLKTYRHIAIESDQLQELFVQDLPNTKLGIAQIIQWSEESFFSHMNSNRDILLRKANNFATIYLVCCLIWSLGTVYYLVKTKSPVISELGLYIKCAAHLISYATLVFFMWWNNRIIDKTKDLIKQILSLKSLKDQESTIDMASLEIVLKNCDSYAKIFQKKPSVPGILITVISTGAPLLVRFIQKDIF